MNKYDIPIRQVNRFRYVNIQDVEETLSRPLNKHTGFMSISRTCRILDRDEEEILNLINSGIIDACYIQYSWRVRVSSVRDFMELNDKNAI